MFNVEWDAAMSDDDSIQHSTFNIQHSRVPVFVVIAIVALLAFAKPLIRGEVPTFRDHSDYFQPLRWFTANELRHGRLPLWNVYNASGERWLANPQTGVFYPPAWLFLALPFATAYTLFLALHVMLAGWGAFLLFSRFASAAAALAAALALMFCGPVMSLVDINNNLATFAWLPLVLWCAMANVGPQWSALAIAMSFLGGEPFFAQRAKGARVWDVDANEYIDYVCTWGPAILGHAHPAIISAVKEAAEQGTSFGIPNPLEVRMARLICSGEFLHFVR